MSINTCLLQEVRPVFSGLTVEAQVYQKASDSGILEDYSRSAYGKAR